MAQWIRALAARPNNLLLIPRTHVEKERTDSHKLSPHLHT